MNKKKASKEKCVSCARPANPDTYYGAFCDKCHDKMFPKKTK